MVFHVDWNPPWYLFFLPSMEAGTVELSASGAIDFRGTRAVKIIFAARSSGTLKKLTGLKIDDHYEIFSDPADFCTCSVTRQERQGKRMRDIQIDYLREDGRLHFTDYDVSVSPPAIKKDTYLDGVPPCVQDYLSALYSLRLRGIATGSVIRSVVGEDDTYKELVARVEKRETIDTPTGRYDAWRINIQSSTGGLFRGGGQFKVWMTADDRKLPVRFEAKARIGKVTGKLIRYFPSGEPQ